MKKVLITQVILLAFTLKSIAQAGLDQDQEFVSYCFVDSISPSQQVEFQKIVNIATKTEYLKTADGTATYTPTGTVIPCFNLTGISECRLRSVSNSSNKRKWQLAISDVSSYHNDIFLVGIDYEEFIGMGSGPGRKSRIPLNYPYFNTTAEGNRFATDIKNWMECKGIHYIDSSTWGKKGVYALDIQIHTVRNNFDINLDNAYYSIALKDPNPSVITKSGGNTVVNSISTYEVCEVYRKEKTGAVYYIMPYYATTPLYPNDASFGLLDRRVDCNYQTNRSDDCDRPASQNCYIAKADSTLCTYYLNIQTKDTIQSIWADGALIPINGSYYATVQPDHKQLQDTIQRWLENSNKYGRISIENSKNASADGWVFTIMYSDVSFDSIQTNRGKYYFDVVDCKDYMYYDVTRNELGGIINCLDQYGRNVMAPPAASVMIPCDQMEHVGGCRYKGLIGGDKYVTSANINYDLSKYSSITFYSASGTSYLTLPNRTGTGTSQLVMTGGMIFSFKSEQKCKYLAKQTVNLLWGSGIFYVTYTW